MNYYTGVWKKFAVFSGRARRKEYWMFMLIHIIVCAILSLIDQAIGMYLLLGIYGLAVLIPSLAVLSRRLHDSGKSAWWILIVLIPYLGALVLIIFAVLDSKPGSNKYGPNPKEGATPAPQM